VALRMFACSISSLEIVSITEMSQKLAISLIRLKTISTMLYSYRFQRKHVHFIEHGRTNRRKRDQLGIILKWAARTSVVRMKSPLLW
jgi:hypothetical protein